MGLVTFYGFRVCPFLEQLKFLQLVTPLAVAYAAVFYVKYQICNHPIEEGDASVLERPWFALKSELAAWS